MSSLLDLLSYNTHYLSMNEINLLVEMFIDTVIIKSSVVSHVKTLGYTSRSVKLSNAG